MLFPAQTMTCFIQVLYNVISNYILIVVNLNVVKLQDIISQSTTGRGGGINSFVKVST